MKKRKKLLLIICFAFTLTVLTTNTSQYQLFHDLPIDVEELL